MQSPILSRSSSTSAFAPGPHRRSHLNLQNISTLSLAPLTPKYPIDPADYNAYFDPGTSELHTSASLSRIATLPSPGGILTNSPVRSRDPSRTRKQRRIKSHVHIREPEGAQLTKSVTEPVEAAPPADRKPQVKQNRSQLRLSKISTDPSWLVQTGLSLTESSRETKGQSWLSKRDSSTSLANTPLDYFTAIDRPREGRTPRSGRATPATGRSRVSSRNTSRTRLAGRNDLRMTTSEATSPTLERGGGGGPFGGMRSKTASFVTAADLELDDQIQEEDEDEDVNVQPNWADARTQAELAAQLQEELGEDYDYDDHDGDPYGMLNFEDQGSDADSDLDEEEVRQAMSRYRIGGWMGLDGAIDALLRVEEVNDDIQLDVEQGVHEMSRGVTIGDVETPPQRAAGAWVDVTWLGRLFGRSAGM